MRRALVSLARDYPLFTRLLGLLIALGGGWLVYQQGLELQRMHAIPSLVDLSILPEAVQFNNAYYVTLKGGQWDCASLSVQPITFDNPRLPETSVIYRSEQSSAILVHLFGSRTCVDLQKSAPTGIIHKIEAPEIYTVRENYPAVESLPRENAVYDLCTNCGPALPAASMVGGALLVAIGLLILPILRSLDHTEWISPVGIYGLGPKWERRKR